MPLVASNTGALSLDYYARCDCADFVYRHEVVPQMTQKQINSRWDKARDTLSGELIWQADGYSAWEVRVTGGSEIHEVHACKSNEDPGPNFMCKHIFAALRLILEEIDGLDVLAFGTPDTDIPHWGGPVSIDGWMVALVKRKEEDDK